MTGYRKGLGLAVLCLAGGCWQEADKIDGTFTEEEWAFLSTEFRLPEPQRCPSGLPDCAAAAQFGQLLFFEPSISGEIAISDPFAPGKKGEAGKIACASCHDSQPAKVVDEHGNCVLLDDNGECKKRRRFFIDSRSQPNNVSSGANYTKHNSLSMVNVGYKSVLADRNCKELGADPAVDLCDNVYSWTAAYADPSGVVLNLAAGAAAMNTNKTIVSSALRANGSLLMSYVATFNGFPAPCSPTELPCHTEDQVFANVGQAFESYVRRLESIDSPFDRYVAGQVGPDGQTTMALELTDSERRGLAVFIGKGMCIDCHRGPLLSDLKFHNTGVPQIGPNVIPVDGGVGAQMEAGKPTDRIGQFLTPPLRHVGETAPYMHAGQFATLAQVIEFYRAGGVADGFSGIRDPRIQPLEIDDDEARDLEAFLRRPLIGIEIPDALATNPAVP